MSGIVDKAPHSRSPVYQYQVDMLVLLIRELLEVYERRHEIELMEWFKLPEYRRFLLGAYACSFVCNNLEPMKDFENYQNSPQEYVQNAGWPKFRHYVHTLLRAERWADGYSSPILDSANSGALAIVADRLERDQSLREPEILLFDEEQK